MPDTSKGCWREGWRCTAHVGLDFGALVLFDIPMEEVVIQKKKTEKQRACNEKVNIYILLQVHFFPELFINLFKKIEKKSTKRGHLHVEILITPVPFLKEMI